MNMLTPYLAHDPIESLLGTAARLAGFHTGGRTGPFLRDIGVSLPGYWAPYDEGCLWPTSLRMECSPAYSRNLLSLRAARKRAEVTFCFFVHGCCRRPGAARPCAPSARATPYLPECAKCT